MTGKTQTRGEARAEYQREYREKNRERLNEYNRHRYADNRTERKVQTREWENRTWGKQAWSRLLRASRQRAKKAGIEHTLTKEWILPRMTGCEMSGLPFDLTRGRTAFSPSIDKIDSSKGYTPDNCRVILWALNAAFCDWGQDTFARIWETVRDRSKANQ